MQAPDDPRSAVEKAPRDIAVAMLDDYGEPPDIDPDVEAQLDSGERWTVGAANARRDRDARRARRGR